MRILSWIVVISCCALPMGGCGDASASGAGAAGTAGAAGSGGSGAMGGTGTQGGTGGAGASGTGGSGASGGNAGAGPHSYSTDFPLTENPISENGHWVNGQAVGLDWADVRTSPGFAFGTESGATGYDDSTALLAGSWGPDQTAQAVVHSSNQNDGIFEEVELRLRSSLSAHSATGYEILFRCSTTANAYTQIVRWNGPLGDFSYVDAIGGAPYGVTEGDVVRATVVGDVITAYINGVQVLQGTDGTFTDGSPGIGFFLQGTTGVNGDYGFTSFTATDGP
jgi:hypothetical protein